MRAYHWLVRLFVVAFGSLSAPILIAQNDLLPAVVVDVIPQVQEGVAVEQQVLMQLKSHLKSQTSFTQAAVELSVEQQEKLAALNDEWLVAEYRKAGEKKLRPQNLGNAIAQAFGAGVAFAPQVNGDEDPAIRVCKRSIDKLISDLLTDQQKEMIELERRAKDDFQAEALAEFTVMLIERQIHLSQKQAQELLPILKGKINKNCGWHVYLSNPQFIPTIPKSALKGVLKDEQIRFIQDLNQQDFLGNDLGLFRMFGIDEAVEQ